jgi:tRNA (guanine-N7-)-methyltransferase
MNAPVVYNSEIEGTVVQKWIIDRSRPLEIEVGSGPGHFLCKLARHKAGTRFIGIDVSRERCDSAAFRVLSWRLRNVIIVNEEAHRFISTHIASNSIRCLHIYFPTPYPRAIGLSERLMGVEFLAQVHRVLVPGGILRIATDHQEYFRNMCLYLRAKPWWNMPWEPPLPPEHLFDLKVGTPCEMKYHGDHHIFELQMMK